MCECLTYADGSMFLCEVCNDIRIRDAGIVERALRKFHVNINRHGRKEPVNAVHETLEFALGDLAKPNPNPF